MRRSCRRILKHTFERILHEAVVNADTPEKQELGNLADIVHPSACWQYNIRRFTCRKRLACLERVAKVLTGVEMAFKVNVSGRVRTW